MHKLIEPIFGYLTVKRKADNRTLYDLDYRKSFLETYKAEKQDRNFTLFKKSHWPWVFKNYHPFTYVSMTQVSKEDNFFSIRLFFNIYFYISVFSFFVLTFSVQIVFFQNVHFYQLALSIIFSYIFTVILSMILSKRFTFYMMQ